MKLRNSLFIGAFLLLGLLGLYFGIKSAPKDQGTSIVLRKSYLFNEKLWSLVQSTERLSVKKPMPPVTKEPRVNGMLGLKENLELKNYKIQIEQPDKSLTLQVEDFKLIPKTDYSTDFRCIEGWSEELHYAGARFSDFMEKYDLGKKPDGSFYQYVGLETPDRGYYVSIDMESMLHPQTVIAYEMNQHPLSLKNGAPIRLVIPIKYGIKSLKRIGRIFFSDTRPRDYWAERGYDWYSGL